VGNPSERAHFEKLLKSKQEQLEAYLKSKNIPIPNIVLGNLPAEYVVDITTDYENYVVFSRLVSKGEAETLTIGLFWFVLEL
jgi:hypothetical protein